MPTLKKQISFELYVRKNFLLKLIIVGIFAIIFIIIFFYIQGKDTNYDRLINSNIPAVERTEIFIKMIQAGYSNFTGLTFPKGTTLSNFDLSNLNLSFVDFRLCNLCTVNLCNANLIKADLSKARLDYANLFISSQIVLCKLISYRF